uniref:Uncharacterized protein n=1 Tax=Aegilops tauschii TaxID=37682 RepID=N1R1W6_AEGTA
MGREMPYMPDAIVSEILAHLPVKPLMGFTCVCKAWQSIVRGDASFHRAHLHLQKPCLLVSPRTVDDDPLHTDKVGLHMWEANQQGTAVPLVYATDFSSGKLKHDLAHCDGLVLLHAESAVHLLNPATRHTRTLPRAFGLRRDPRSGAYKVACFSYRSWTKLAVTVDYHSMRMEVFTIGTDRHWRETPTQPSYPTVAQRTATFYKGSLIWTVFGDTAPGFLRFCLEDEAFGVIQPPPCHPRLECVMSRLAELRVCGTRRYNLRTKSYKNMFCMEDFGINSPSTGIFEDFSYFDVIPYIPSLISISDEVSTS